MLPSASPTGGESAPQRHACDGRQPHWQRQSVESLLIELVRFINHLVYSQFHSGTGRLIITVSTLRLGPRNPRCQGWIFPIPAKLEPGFRSRIRVIIPKPPDPGQIGAGVAGRGGIRGFRRGVCLQWARLSRLSRLSSESSSVSLFQPDSG